MDEHGDEDQSMMEHGDDDQRMNDEDDDDSWCSDNCLFYDTSDDDISIFSNASDKHKNCVPSDDETNSGNKAPSWVRLPSEETEYSDWQIDVEFAEALELTGYLVHRYKIGPSCDYFKSMFRDEYGFSESNIKRCVIKFPKDMPVDVDREHFELFLDYLYCDDAWKWEEAEILPLLYLSDYFGVERLRTEAMEALEYNMAVHSSSEWIAGTYRLAESLSLKDIQFTIESICYYNHFQFCEIWDCMESDDLKSRLFHRIFRAQKNQVVGASNGSFWHSTVGHVMELSPNIVDKDLFAELTVDLLADIELRCVLPEQNHSLLTGKQVIDYLKHEHRLFLDAPESDSLTDLQKECVRYLLQRQMSVMREFYDKLEPCDMVEALGTLKPAIMRSLLFQLLEKKFPGKLEEEGGFQQILETIEIREGYESCIESKDTTMEELRNLQPASIQSLLSRLLVKTFPEKKRKRTKRNGTIHYIYDDQKVL